MARKKKRLVQRLEAATGSREQNAPPSFGPPTEDDLPIEAAAFVGAVIVGLLIIMGLAIVSGTRWIEESIEAQAIGGLRSVGIRSLEVDADGTKLTLFGAVREEKQVALALAVANAVDGVTEVDGEDVIYVPPLPEIEIDFVAEPLVFSWTAGDATITGTVSDQVVVEAIVAQAGEIWASVDTSALTVEPGLDPESDWLPAILSVVRRAGSDLPEGTVLANAEASYVLVAGELESRSAQVSVHNDVREILSALTFEFTSGLTVKPPPPPPTVPGSSPPESTTTTVAPEVIELQVTLDELIEGKVVEFEFDSATITAEGELLLDEVLEALRMFPEVPVEIGGHTDDKGTSEFNLRLSRLRAAAVLDYLLANGEAATRFSVIGYGETQPIADNATEEGRSHNRRIEFTALSE